MLAMSDIDMEQFFPIFANTGVPVAFLVPTPTGYGKSIMDATGPVRELFKNANLHDYETQGQLVRHSSMLLAYETTKTEAGVRDIPMSPEVEECFHNLSANRKQPKYEVIIDGKAGFYCLDKNDRPMVALHWQHFFNHIVAKYNGIYKIQLPNITPHVCRHTFCSKMARKGMNPKNLQYIMGHSEYSVTMDTYTEL